MSVSRIFATTVATAALMLAAAPAGAGTRIEPATPYVNACTLAGSHLADVHWNQVLPGPSFVTATGVRIHMLAAGHIPMTCLIDSSMRIESISFD